MPGYISNCSMLQILFEHIALVILNCFDKCYVNKKDT